jgi:hypothetical protein
MLDFRKNNLDLQRQQQPSQNGNNNGNNNSSSSSNNSNNSEYHARRLKLLTPKNVTFLESVIL